MSGSHDKDVNYFDTGKHRLALKRDGHIIDSSAGRILKIRRRSSVAWLPGNYVSDLSLFARRANFITVDFLVNRSGNVNSKPKNAAIGGTRWRDV
jgi:hypothetical protein